MTIRARVFSKDGNRFLIPGYWCDEGNEDWDGMSISSILCEGMMLGVVAGFDSHQEWMEFEPKPDGTGHIAHFPMDLVGRHLAHGGIKVLVIGGPLFDEAMSKELAGE